MNSQDITLVVTSCGRYDLLARTLDSLFAYSDLTFAEVILAEDWEGMSGQVRMIDKAYCRVKTPYIFHCEDDWEFYKRGFLGDSLEILEKYPDILQVWIRAHNDTNGHPIERRPEYDVPTMVYGFEGMWHGFAWNPGLRRLADYHRFYHRLGSYSSCTQGFSSAQAESVIGSYYKDAGFRAAILPEVNGYARHIGGGGRGLKK